MGDEASHLHRWLEQLNCDPFGARHRSPFDRPSDSIPGLFRKSSRICIARCGGHQQHVVGCENLAEEPSGLSRTDEPVVGLVNDHTNAVARVARLQDELVDRHADVAALSRKSRIRGASRYCLPAQDENSTRGQLLDLAVTFDVELCEIRRLTLERGLGLAQYAGERCEPQPEHPLDRREPAHEFAGHERLSDACWSLK